MALTSLYKSRSKKRPLSAIKKLLAIFYRIYPILVVMCLWEILGRSKVVPYYFLPPMSDIIFIFIARIIDGSLLFHSSITLYRALTGYVLSILMGIPLGICMANFKIIRWFFDPIVALILPLPPIVLIPAFTLWFGVGHESKILLVIIACVFIIALSTYNGARNISTLMVWSARALGTSKRRILWRIMVPASMPFIFNGLQVSLPISLIVAFVFEMVSGGTGLGFVETYSARFFRAPELFSALFSILLIGLILDEVLQKIRQKILKWL